MEKDAARHYVLSCGSEMEDAAKECGFHVIAAIAAVALDRCLDEGVRIEVMENNSLTFALSAPIIDLWE